MKDIGDKIILGLPYTKIIGLLLDLVTISRGGLNKDEAEKLLKELSSIIKDLEKVVQID